MIVRIPKKGVLNVAICVLSAVVKLIAKIVLEHTKEHLERWFALRIFLH